MAGHKGSDAGPGSPDRELINMQQAIDLLKTTRPTFYRWLRAGKLKGFKVGRQWRFYKEDIERFFKGQAPRIDLPADISPLIECLRSRLDELGGDSSISKKDSPTEQAVKLVIRLALSLRASDIHIDPHPNAEGDTVVGLRYRVDGVLHMAAEIDIRLLPAIIEQWKRMAACDVHEKSRPQDGRIVIELKSPEKRLDLRVSFLPASLGESVTVRILDPESIRLDLDRIEFRPKDMERIKKWLSSPWGLILLTGPTGSGKTTVLYSAMNHIARPEVKVMSVEDPVEFHLPWVVQVHVRNSAGLTFPAAMRSILRSDPDVIMCGEIRDRETMSLCQQAALTGHLVLSTLHTDEAARALTRMVEMGSDPFLVGDSTKLIVAQRLVRRLCPKCGKKKKLPAESQATAKRIASAGGLGWPSIRKDFRISVGCPHCVNRGFRGRTVIAEVLEVTPKIGGALRDGASVEELRAIAISEGMTTMGAHGILLSSEGLTTLDEVLRVLALK